VIVVRIEVRGQRVDVRWADAEAVVGAGAAAAIQRDDAGWAPREAVLVHLGDSVLLVRADGSGQVRMYVGDTVHVGDATLTLVGLEPLAATSVPAGPARALAPSLVGARSSVEGPTLALTASPFEFDDDAAGIAGAPASPAPRPGPAAPVASATTPKSLTGASFDEELADVLRRSPWWVLSAVVHGLLFLLMSVLVPATPLRPRPEVVHGMVSATALADEPLESGGPLDRAEPDAPPEEVEAPILDDPWLEPEPALPDPLASDDDTPPIPLEAEEPLPPSAIDPLVGPTGSMPRLKLAEKNVVGKKPAPVDLDHIHEDAERAREVNQHAAARVRADIAKGGGPLGRVLKGLRTDDILVVRGSFDHMENTLEELGLPFTLKAPFEMPGYALERHKLVFWNCGENVLRPHEHERVVRAVRDFVQGGGYLFTTDWALANLVMPAFPGYLRTRGRIHPLPELIVDVEPAEGMARHRLLEGVFEAETRPRWWLEQASFDVEVLRKDEVVVLAEAPALARAPLQRGTAIALTFTVGRGRVLHVVGHYFQQKGNVSGAIGVQRMPLNFVRMRLEAVGTAAR